MVVYVIGVIGVGVWMYRRTDSLDDFVLGGRSLGSVPAALSAQASDVSGWLLLGLPRAYFMRRRRSRSHPGRGGRVGGPTTGRAPLS